MCTSIPPSRRIPDASETMEGPHEIILETGEKIYVTRLVRFFVLKGQTEVVVMIPCVCHRHFRRGRPNKKVSSLFSVVASVTLHGR